MAPSPENGTCAATSWQKKEPENQTARASEPPKESQTTGGGNESVSGVENGWGCSGADEKRERTSDGKPHPPWLVATLTKKWSASLPSHPKDAQCPPL